MKNLFFFCSLLMLVLLNTKVNAQSLIDADSMIVIQQSDSNFTAMAVTIYRGLSASTIKAIFKERFEKSNRQKLDFARQAIQFEEKAKRNEAKYTEITGDTIAIDSSINLAGDWTIKGGEVSLKFSVSNNQSTSNKVKIKIVSTEELIISVDKVGEVAFYKQDATTWIGKADTLYKMTLDKPKAKNKN